MIIVSDVKYARVLTSIPTEPVFGPRCEPGTYQTSSYNLLNMKYSLGNRTEHFVMYIFREEPTHIQPCAPTCFGSLLTSSGSSSVPLNDLRSRSTTASHTPRRQTVIHIHLLHRFYLHHTPAYTSK
jgi:hypothetical protein